MYRIQPEGIAADTDSLLKGSPEEKDEKAERFARRAWLLLRARGERERASESGAGAWRRSELGRGFESQQQAAHQGMHCREPALLSMRRAQPTGQPDRFEKRVVLHRKLLPLDDFDGRLLKLDETAWQAVREPLVCPPLLWSSAADNASDVRVSATAVVVVEI